MIKKLKIALIVSLLLLGLGAYLPIRQVVVVPRWEVRLVDESQRPLSNIHVKQEWIDHTYEFWRPGKHSDVLVTNSNGEVVFPERVISVTIVAEILARFRDLITLNPHASFGPFSTVSCDKIEFFCHEAFSSSDPSPLTLTVLRGRSD